MEKLRSFPHVIHFFGPDGAGKSTQADILVNMLSRQGFRVKKYWVRSPHTLAFVLWRIFVRIGFYRSIPNPYGVTVKLPAVDRNPVLRYFWQIVEFISIVPVIVRSYIYLLSGYRLIAERYILDAATTIAYFINDIDFIRGRTSKLLFQLIPKSTAFVFLDSDYDAIYIRRAPSIDPRKYSNEVRNNYSLTSKGSLEPPDFIEFQRKAYKILAKSFDSLTIDTSELSIEETSHRILQYLEPC